MVTAAKPAAKAKKLADVFDTGRLSPRHLLEKPLAEVLGTITQRSSPIDVLTVLIDRIRTQDARFGKDVFISMDPENPLGLEIGFVFEGAGRTWTFNPENSSNVMFELAGVSTTSGEAAFRIDTPRNLISRLADWLEGREEVD